MTQKDPRDLALDVDVAPEAEGRRASLSRRSFLKAAAATTGAAGLVTTTATTASASGLVPESDPEELAREHADDPGALERLDEGLDGEGPEDAHPHHAGLDAALAQLVDDHARRAGGRADDDDGEDGEAENEQDGAFKHDVPPFPHRW